MNYRAIAKRLLQEHPQTTAVLLARLEPEHSSEILKFLPDFVQSDLMGRIVHVDQLPEEIIEEIDILLSTILRSR